jgi:hypothetical protein
MNNAQRKIIYFLDPAPIILGLPSPPRNWAPLVDTSIPEELRIPMFAHWVTGYFQHENLPARSLEDLSYVLPITDRVPSIFKMSVEEKNMNVYDGKEANIDMPLMIFFIPQQLSGFQTAIFNNPLRNLLRYMKVLLLIGESSPSFAPAGLWAAEEQDQLHGGGFIIGKTVPGGNHFVSLFQQECMALHAYCSLKMHWDMPETMMDSLVKFLGSD